MKNVIFYFKVFPLLTKKALSFEKCLAIHNLVINKLHLTEGGLSQVRVLSKEIDIYNSMRTKTGSAYL